MLYIGCHLSASDGYVAMLNQAVSINANTFAFFTRNPRGGNAKKINNKDAEKFNELCKQKNFGKLVAHAPYTMNPCAADPKIRDFSASIMKDDIERMECTPNNYYNLHPGSHVKQGTEIGIELISRQLNTVLKPEQTTAILLETMAGKGSEMGRNFTEIQDIISNVNLKSKIGVCLDTCHIWDAGYDVAGNLNGVLEEFDKIIGLDRLKAVHLNDSLNPKGSHKDRHAKIGQGTIGLDALIRVINHPALKNLPFILETPNDWNGYKNEIEILRKNYSE